MFTVQRHVGRLIEVRMRTPTNMQEIDDSSSSMEKILQGLEPKNGVVCADYAAVRVLKVDLANRLLAVFRHFTPRIERSGLLIAADSSVALLQMERVIRNAENPMRRTFRSVDELKEWLRSALNPAERARVDEFFLEVD